MPERIEAKKKLLSVNVNHLARRRLLSNLSYGLCVVFGALSMYQSYQTRYLQNELEELEYLEGSIPRLAHHESRDAVSAYVQAKKPIFQDAIRNSIITAIVNVGFSIGSFGFSNYFRRDGLRIIPPRR